MKYTGLQYIVFVIYRKYVSYVTTIPVLYLYINSIHLQKELVYNKRNEAENDEFHGSLLSASSTV